MRIVPFSAAALVIAAALIAGCGGGVGQAGAADTGPAQQLTVTLTELKFEPSNFTVQAGRPVEVKVQNRGTMEHDFTIGGMPASDVKNAVGAHAHRAGEIAGHAMAGHDATIRFTPTTPGRYGIYCSLPGHKEAGMIGFLTVT